MPKVVKILSIDGGGIRGVIPGLLLADIERRSGKRIFELFDLIAGTSTGGILTAALTCPSDDGVSLSKYRASDVVDLYRNEGTKIFSNSANLFQKFFRPSYGHAGIESVLKTFFGTHRLKEALKPILVTSYEIEHRQTIIFNSHRAKQDPRFDFELAQVARATSAAPTYFNPYKLERSNPPLYMTLQNPTTGEFERVDVPYYALVDGGVFANNPTMIAYAECMRFRGKEFEQDVDDQQFFIVSLGTGEASGGLKIANLQSAASWVLGKGVPVISTFFQAGSATVYEQSYRICGHPPDQLHRFQARIDPENEPMDNASKANIDALERFAKLMIQQNDKEIERVCNDLIELFQKS